LLQSENGTFFSIRWHIVTAGLRDVATNGGEEIFVKHFLVCTNVTENGVMLFDRIPILSKFKFSVETLFDIPCVACKPCVHKTSSLNVK